MHALAWTAQLTGGHMHEKSLKEPPRIRSVGLTIASTGSCGLPGAEGSHKGCKEALQTLLCILQPFLRLVITFADGDHDLDATTNCLHLAFDVL